MNLTLKLNSSEITNPIKPKSTIEFTYVVHYMLQSKVLWFAFGYVSKIAEKVGICDP